MFGLKIGGSGSKSQTNEEERPSIVTGRKNPNVRPSVEAITAGDDAGSTSFAQGTVFGDVQKRLAQSRSLMNEEDISLALVIKNPKSANSLMKIDTEDKILTGMSSLPKYTVVLSAGDSRSVVSIPQDLEKFVCVLETGVKKAVILYDPSRTRDTKRHISMIKSKLVANNFKIEGKDLKVNSSVIAQILDNHRQQAGSESAVSGQVSLKSEAKILFESWVLHAVDQNATDIHIQVINSRAEVKIRVDSELEFIKDENNGVYTPIQVEKAVAWAYNNASEKKSNSNSTFVSTDNLYTMIEPRDILGKRVALRFQSVRGHAGLKAVCRLLYVDIDAPTKPYEALGYAPSHIEQLENAANTSAGMIIFSGVTGSGKTTSLKTFVETHPANGTDAFYSIEDPVEYPLRGVHQIPIQRDLLDREGSAAKYAEVVGALMRADPGVVLTGEIRDTSTAMAAQQIVETGHMAAGTLHAHLVSGIIPRLTNDEVGMSRDVLTNPNVLSLLAYQALVPKLCPKCKINGLDYADDMDGGKHVMKILGTLENRFGIPAKKFFFKRPGGCSACSNRGTVGLTVVAEILDPDRTWLDLIREKRDYEALVYYRTQSDGDFYSENMKGKTVFEHTLYKALLGIVDPRQCERFDTFEKFEIPKHYTRRQELDAMEEQALSNGTQG